MKHYWERLIGDKGSFSLEARIFHAVCIALIAGVSINVPISFYLHIPQLVILLSIVSAVAAVLYYISRFKGRHQLSAAIFQVFVCITLVINYYFNSGINGPTYTIFLLAFLVSVATTPARQYYVWLPLNILLIIGLMTYELLTPGAIAVTYADNISRYVDFTVSYLVIAGFAFLVTGYIRKAYNCQREELMAQSEALHTANITKNKLLSILGHDLKEPLASLQGYLEILSDFDLDEVEKKEINSHLLAMTRSTSMMLTNILMWTNRQRQSFRADLQTLPVSETLRLAVDIAHIISSNKNIALTIDIPAEMQVQADQQMLELIVRNLLMNAIKFTPKQGNIELSAHNKDSKCVIKISDDGIGIPSELQPQIFSLQTKSRLGTEQEKGAGLGLMLCKEFAELMGGKLTFKSKTNEGTTFTLTLPAVNPAVPVEQV